MRVAIMQPYFLPYLGYFQLASAADCFVIYDNIQYTKKGWINRNRILLNGREHIFSIPLSKSSDYADIRDKYISPEFNKERKSELARIKNGYSKCTSFPETYSLFCSIFNNTENNLFEFIRKAIQALMEYMNIRTELVVSSSLPVDHSLKGQERVISICRHLGAKTYINPIGGQLLYSKEAFAANSIELLFHSMKVVPYPQASPEFISHLSIIDVLMNNPVESLPCLLRQYELLD